MKKTIVGVLVVVYRTGVKSTYRWVDEWTYKSIASRDLANAQEMTAKAKKLLPAIERDARTLTEAEFRKKHQQSPVDVLLMLRNPVGTSTMTLRTIEVEPVFGGEFLGFGSSLQINFADVKSIAYKEKRAVDDFGP